MKAVVYTEYGPPSVMRVTEVDQPVPAADEVLIKLVAVGLNRSDWETLIGSPLYSRIGGLRKPGRQILGSDIAGRVEAVGASVTRFKVGDAVYGDILARMGGFAEYVCAREKWLLHKPDGLTFEQAATIPQAGVIALQGLRDKGRVSQGQQVLINGAGGGGTFAVQLARLYGAEVTAVDNGGKLDFLRSIGADHAIDYKREDYTRGSKKYDMVLDLVAHRPAFAYRRALKRGGSFYMVGGSVATIFQILLLGPLISRLSGKNVRMLAVQQNRGDIEHMAELCASGKIVPLIDRRFSLEQVPEALAYLGAGRVRGKVIISMGEEGK